MAKSKKVIAVPGSTGTLAEIGMAWEFIAKKLLQPNPLILLGDFWAPLYRILVPAPKGDPTFGGIVRIEPTPKAAIDFLRAYWKD